MADALLNSFWQMGPGALKMPKTVNKSSVHSILKIIHLGEGINRHNKNRPFHPGCTTRTYSRRYLLLVWRNSPLSLNAMCLFHQCFCSKELPSYNSYNVQCANEYWTEKQAWKVHRLVYKSPFKSLTVSVCVDLFWPNYDLVNLTKPVKNMTLSKQ